MKLAVTGSANAVARPSTVIPWTACRNPMPTFHRRREDAGPAVRSPARPLVRSERAWWRSLA